MPSPFSPKEHKKIIHPLIARFEKLYQKNQTTIIGIQGGQGTGKTTLVKVLQKELQNKGYRVVSFSIDDFYLSLRERKALHQKYPQNPFYQIPRGLPGTHRLPLLTTVLSELKHGQRTELPIFDKSVDNGQGDISPLKTIISQRQDFVLFEGWCVGIPDTTPSALALLCSKQKIPLNKIDPTLQHSAVVLHFIRSYRPLWKFLDYLVMLRPQTASLHVQWRQQQERELKKARGQGMSAAEIAHFVNLFLPFTYLCYEKTKADATIVITKDHTFSELRWNEAVHL
ncbi:hypothetical protein HY495_03545 [Candidatus Woesearchaeota archaeon]|nr:hypothetical protein [Candidatus Woesearchaeota archaeon]